MKCRTIKCKRNQNISLVCCKWNWKSNLSYIQLLGRLESIDTRLSLVFSSITFVLGCELDDDCLAIKNGRTHDPINALRQSHRRWQTIRNNSLKSWIWGLHGMAKRIAKPIRCLCVVWELSRRWSRADGWSCLRAKEAQSSLLVGCSVVGEGQASERVHKRV